MKIVNVVQGSPEWHEHRRNHFNASDCAAMLGKSKYKSRAQLVKEYATGIIPEVDAATQARFDQGHATEAAARLLLEHQIGEELYPVVGVKIIDGLPLSASLDGLTMDGSIAFEHKLYNQALAASLERGIIPEEYCWQLEQQMMVSDCERTIFVDSDGTPANWAQADYVGRPELRQVIISGWKQFAEDVKNYQPEPPIVEPVAVAIESLPAIRIEVTGMVTASNLEQFKVAAKAAIAQINIAPETDQEFADTELAVKWCADVEKRIDGAKAHALSQTASIDELFRMLDEVKESVRQTRLAAEKAVKSGKDEKKQQIVLAASQDLMQHVKTLSVHVPPVRLNMDCVKGLKTLSSYRENIAAELAIRKAEATRHHDHITRSLEILKDKAADYRSLFADVGELVLKDHETLGLLIDKRIADHVQEQAARAEREERAKAEAERAKIAAELAAQATSREFRKVAPENSEIPNIPSTEITLGKLAEKLGIPVSADYLASIGFVARKERASSLYRESDIPSICTAIIGRLERVRSEYQMVGWIC